MRPRTFGFAPRHRAVVLAAALPFAQAWSDPGLISRDDDWSAVAGVVGYRGDGLTAAAGVDPRTVVVDGSSTPVDVNANESDPAAVGLTAGVAEFELPDPVVALQGSATAAAPHLVLSLDTRGRSGVTVRYRLRDVDPSSIANAVQPVALQYRVGGAGPFETVPGGFVADATTGPGAATLVTPVSAVLPAAADDRPLVQLRILTTNAVGQDEWVGVDDIEVDAGGAMCTPPGEGVPAPPPGEGPPAPPRGEAAPGAPLAPAPGDLIASHVALTNLTLTPRTFTAARKGPAVSRTGRGGAALRFHLSRRARVEFRVTGQSHPGLAGRRPPRAEPVRTPGGTSEPEHPLARTPPVPPEIGGFSVRGRRGLNRLRFSGRLRGRALPAGPYRLTAVAIDRDAPASPPVSIPFRVR